MVDRTKRAIYYGEALEIREMSPDNLYRFWRALFLAPSDPSNPMAAWIIHTISLGKCLRSFLRSQVSRRGTHSVYSGT